MRTCAGTEASEAPRNSTSPDSMRTSPATAFASVDLPAPFGPSSTRISPAARTRLAPRTIGSPGS